MARDGLHKPFHNETGIWVIQQSDLGPSLTAGRQRKREFLAQMERVVPCPAVVELVMPCISESKKDRLPFVVATMRRIHFMQQGFTLSDPVMVEALQHAPLS